MSTTAVVGFEWLPMPVGEGVYYPLLIALTRCDSVWSLKVHFKQHFAFDGGGRGYQPTPLRNTTSRFTDLEFLGPGAHY